MTRRFRRSWASGTLTALAGACKEAMADGSIYLEALEAEFVKRGGQFLSLYDDNYADCHWELLIATMRTYGIEREALRWICIESVDCYQMMVGKESQRTAQRVSSSSSRC